MKLLIKRIEDDEKQTLGIGKVVDKENKIIYQFTTLELADKDNQKRISCIPKGIYKVKKRVSKKYGTHFHILDVPNRSFILIHHGNYHTDILGCILCGDYNKGFVDINKDGYKDVVSSKPTMKKLLDILPDSFELTIN